MASNAFRPFRLNEILNSRLLEGDGRSRSSSKESSTSSSRASSPNPRTSTIAFAFDIDGVLVRSATSLPGASEAISRLQECNIPFIFLTNGGGKTERDHVELLAKRLKVQLSEEQFVQSHTPFKDHVPELRDKSILVLGGTGNSIREVAQSYGFKNVFTPSDIFRAFPDVYPFAELTAARHIEHGIAELPLNHDGLFQISAILVWSSPRDWGHDLQLVMDLLLSEKGIINTVSPLNGRSELRDSGYGQDGQPTLHWCNPDLTWATKHTLPRVAQGSFRAALQGIWKSQTGIDFLPNEHIIGKPTLTTYVYGEKVLANYNRMINGDSTPTIDTVYMIGDNPASDIQGANTFQSPRGYKWKSILVESGVHRAGETPAFKPDYTVPGVSDAVDLALKLQDAELGSELSTPFSEVCGVWDGVE